MSRELLDRIEEHGARTALIESSREYSYAELAARAQSTAQTLHDNGIGPQDAVVLQGRFGITSIACLLALHARGNIVAPVTEPTALARASLEENCRPSHWIDAREGLAIERLARSADPERPLLARLRQQGSAGLILLSSGTTSQPKVILHDLSRIVDSKLASGRKGGRLSIVLFLLFDHIGGINTLLGSLIAGNTAVAIRDHGPDEVCSLVQRHKVRVLPTSPTFLNLLLVGGYPSRYDLSSLKLITYGTEPMPEALLGRVRAALPGARMLQTFGTSETGISGTTSESSRSTYFKIEDDQFEHRIVDGELYLRSRTQFLGYLSQKTENVTEDGWFKTGDLVEIGSDGYMRIKGRVSDTINVGGEKVLPMEVESVLLSSPLIADCVVYGEPNALTGQHVCAEVRPRAPMPPAALRSHVREFLGERLDPYKVPARVKAVDEIRYSERFKKLRRQA